MVIHLDRRSMLKVTEGKYFVLAKTESEIGKTGYATVWTDQRT